MRSDRLAAIAPVLLVGLMAALSFWLDRIAQPPARGLGASRHDPDYFVEKLNALHLGASGSADYTLSAAKMTHYPDDDSTILALPKFVSYRSAKAPVTITASQAVVSSNGEHVYFQDDVLVIRAPDRDMSELVVRTAFLHVMPELSLAKTDRTVTITDDATKVTAEGLELDGETRVIKLLSRVKGIYDPGKAVPRGAKR